MHTALRRQTLGDLLHRSARRFADKAAIICGDTAWSYA
jgi:fatty-acyl-CoA synthase